MLLPNKKLVNAVLADINALRKRIGLPPVIALLRGHRHSHNNCSVARTLVHGLQPDGDTVVGHRTGTVTVYIFGPARYAGELMFQEIHRHVWGQTTQRFIRDFDRNRYPELVIR